MKTELSSDELINRIQSELGEDTTRCDGETVSGFATICPPKTEQHFWSPQLTITVEEDEEGTTIRGLYGPRPAVWTMFVFFYTFIGFALMIVIMVGLSLRSLGEPAGILWLVPILILVFLSLYLVAYFGQKLGHKQMTSLHRFIERCVGNEIEAD
ncbi:MAG TPA: hypothetical protein DEQ34_08755 [Balneolaceae bacterium]|nr:hypothetical protein [Balneolaceae bacterium]